ncbi:MAG: anti-sigma factor [Gammaproteobacteria bacterium]|nr:anti-sigma factor [Gammaproteobacteria bacterium]
MRYHDPELQALLAGKYVLGNLQGRARRRFETLMLEDAELRHQVNLWAQRLEPLNDELEARNPPASVWTAIEQQIGSDKNPIWNNLAFWRPLGAVAVAASLMLALLVGITIYKAPGPERIAFVTDAEDQPVWLVSATPRSRKLRIKTLKPMDMPAGEVCVLWLVWKDGATQGIAVLPDNTGETSVALPKGMQRDPNKAKLVVTVESGDDAVTNMQGEVMFKGPWVEL